MFIIMLKVCARLRNSHLVFAYLLFSCRFVQEQEVSMLSEIEHLESLLADIVKQTYNPAALPIVGEDLVRNLRLSDHSSGSWDDEQVHMFLNY